jgi:hypothetical protein
MKRTIITLPRLLPCGLAILLSACSSGPPVPDWQMNAQNSVERFQNAYMEGNALVEAEEFKRARAQVARTGKTELVIRIELVRCATRVASLVFEACAGYEKLSADAAGPERAYAQYLAGAIPAQDIALLPPAHRAVAGAASDTAAAAVGGIADPLSKLVAAGVLMRTGRASPALLAIAVDTASNQGWRRALLAWLGVQALRAEQAGEAQEAQRIRRRIDLVQGTDQR